MTFTQLRNAVEVSHREGVGSVVALAFYDAFGLPHPRGEQKPERRRRKRRYDNYRQTVALMNNRIGACDRQGK